MSNVEIPFASGSIGSGLGLAAALAGVWRRKRLVLWIIAAALAVGIAAVVMMPARYTAQAYIRGEFVASDTLPMQVKNMSTGTMSTGPISLDPARVIETQSRLLQSNRLARRVVSQLGLERLQPLLNSREWSSDILSFNGSAARGPEDQVDLAASLLLKGLSVTSEPRAYLITVRYSAADPELAEIIANAFVAELLRSTRLQVLSQQRHYAQATLSNQLGKFGSKHPKIAELTTQLSATNDALEKQMNESREAILQAAGENVTKAVAGPSGPRPIFVVGLILIFGLLIGVATSLWLERSKWWLGGRLA